MARRTQSKQPSVDRRRFLSGAAVAGAAATAAPVTATAATAPDPIAPQRLPSAVAPSARMAAAEVGAVPEMKRDNGAAGSDFMVDVIKSLDIKYMPCNPASSFRGIHESLINYGGNKMPEFLTCAHEESAVAMCHGYYKASGK